MILSKKNLLFGNFINELAILSTKMELTLDLFMSLRMKYGIPSYILLVDPKNVSKEIKTNVSVNIILFC